MIEYLLCKAFAGHGCFEHGSESWQLQIVNALRLGERTRASSLLSDLVYRNHLSRADDFVYVLDFCARLPDPLVGSTINLFSPYVYIYIFS